MGICCVNKKAIVDIDNTLWHFCDALYEELRKINRRFPTPDSWTHWDLWEGYCTEGDSYSAVNAIHLNQHNDNYLPYPEAQDFLIGLKDNGYHITIASHRSPDYRRQTELWLEKHGLVHVGGARKEPNMAAVARCRHRSGREKPSINPAGDELIHKSKPICKFILI